MSRKVPYWYHRYFPSVMASFKESFDHPEPGIYVLPDFTDVVYERDCIHLNEISGTS
jgi:hypothetical protein